MPSRTVPTARRRGTLKSTEAFTRFVLDQLETLGGVVPRSMFGGVGLYCGDQFFGIIARDVLYLKVDEATRSDYEGAGSTAFKPYSHRPATMQYYAVPAGVLESAPELVAWARKAVAAAARGRAAGSTARRRRMPSP